MSTSRFSEKFVQELKSRGILTYVHTINSDDVAQELQRKGVYGFYTDFLTPKDLLKTI